MSSVRVLVAAMMMVAVASGCSEPPSCAVSDLGAGARAGERPAVRALRWACAQRACVTPGPCADPEAATLDDATVDALTACVLGPCEERSACAAAVVAECARADR